MLLKIQDRDGRLLSEAFVGGPENFTKLDVSLSGDQLFGFLLDIAERNAVMEGEAPVLKLGDVSVPCRGSRAPDGRSVVELFIANEWVDADQITINGVLTSPLQEERAERILSAEGIMLIEVQINDLAQKIASIEDLPDTDDHDVLIRLANGQVIQGWVHPASDFLSVEEMQLSGGGKVTLIARSATAP